MVSSSKVYTCVFAFLVCLVIATKSFAGSAAGTWLRPSNGAHITVFDCEGGLGMKVDTAPIPEHVGKTIMCGAKKETDDIWQGDILNLDNGKTYSGKVVLKGDTLELSGCVLGGLVCKNETWARVK
jgi:uncharacterized protein (DUF2147 family)